MIFVHYGITICFLGIHYPLARWYVARALSGVAPEQAAAINVALRPRLMLLLVVWTACGLAAALAAAISGGAEAVLSGIASLSIFAFHAIWWPFVMPLFTALDRELKRQGIERSTDALRPTRTATLTPRRPAEYLPMWMRLLPLAIGVSGVGGMLWRASVHAPEEPRTVLLMTVFGLSGLFFLVVWTFWIRREIATSYVMDDPLEGARDRIESAEALRRFRVRGISILQSAAAAAFFAAAIASLEAEHGAISEQQLGIAGGIIGTAVGIAGGVFGTMASLRAHRVQRRG